MFRSKALKKKTRNRQTLLRNLRKGKARLEARCAFQSIPNTTKFDYSTKVHHLYGDLVLLEKEDTFVTEPSLINSFKKFKNVQVSEYLSQKVVRVQAENAYVEPSYWRELVERLEHSESEQMREWAVAIKDYSQRYELMVKELNEQNDRIVMVFKEMHSQTEKLKSNLMKNFPCIEIKYQFKYGHFQMSEVVYNEKLVGELGYNLDSFATAVFEEGLPRLVSFGNCNTFAAKARLDNFLNMTKDSYQSKEIDASFYLKSGYMKKGKMQFHYRPTLEKGYIGYTVITPIVFDQEPFADFSKPVQNKVNTTFIDTMATREKEVSTFLLKYYNQHLITRYQNVNRTCKIRDMEENAE